MITLQNSKKPELKVTELKPGKVYLRSNALSPNRVEDVIFGVFGEFHSGDAKLYAVGLTGACWHSNDIQERFQEIDITVTV